MYIIQMYGTHKHMQYTYVTTHSIDTVNHDLHIQLLKGTG